MDIQEFATANGLSQNENGGFYISGVEFGKVKWVEIIAIYFDAINEAENSECSCSIRELARQAKISNHSAAKAIAYYEAGYIPRIQKGHARKGVGTMKAFRTEHDAYIYRLYQRKPKRPIESYMLKFNKKFDIELSHTFITRWFHQIGRFKGTMRATSKFPPAKNSWLNLELLEYYLKFMESLDHHVNVVFADEKPMKEIDVHGLVRRDPLNGDVPTIECNANSKNRWNILAACSVKKNLKRALEYIMIDEKGDACLFQEFVAHLIEIGLLERGDIFVIDNCSIHMSGENEFLQETLWKEAGILMIPLPPYSPELNPIKLVFNDLVQHLRSWASRSESVSSEEFKQVVMRVLSSSLFSRKDIKKKYKHRGYSV